MTAFYPGRPPIDSYGNGGFRFAGISHRGSILVLPSGVYKWTPDPAVLKASDFAAILAERDGIDLLLLGMGSVMTRPPRAVAETIAASGMMLDFMTTGAAVSTYNLLHAENRKVAAALIAVEDAA